METKMDKIAIIRIRGTNDVKQEIENTMRMLHLHKKHTCSVYPNTPVIMGMLVKCKDYITYGTIDEETYKLLVDKRGMTKEGKKVDYFHLSPPRGGFERKGIKTPFSMKGALGDRGEKINLLLKKMI
jgi:large subunit ribosomal protein L30